MRRFRIETDGRRVQVSDAEFEKDCVAIVKPKAGHLAKPPISAEPMRRLNGQRGKKLSGDDPGLSARLMSTGAKPPGPETADDRRRRAAAMKTNLEPLLKEADEFLERARLHDIEKSTQTGRAAIVRRLKAKYP